MNFSFFDLSSKLFNKKNDPPGEPIDPPSKPIEKIFTHSKNILSVLVEDEERIRRFWNEYFALNKMPLLVFSSDDEFLREIDKINVPTQFYFDQDFGSRRGVGVELANHVFKMPIRFNTNLITSYPLFFFKQELEDGILDFILPKYPIDIFGENYFENRMKREIEEKGVACILKESVQQLEESFKPLLKAVSDLKKKDSHKSP